MTSNMRRVPGSRWELARLTQTRAPGDSQCPCCGLEITAGDAISTHAGYWVHDICPRIR